MDTKLVVNFVERSVQVEGTEEFVRFVYQDFKDHLAEHAAGQLPTKILVRGADSEQIAEEKDTPRKKSNRTNKGDNDKPKAAEYKPRFISDINLASLDEFYDAWKPTNNSEKILLFAVFLRDRLQIAPCNADQIYTCFFTLKGKTKTPVAFAQAFHNAKSRTHFIEFDSLQKIIITIAGDNHFNERLQDTKGTDR